MNDMETVVAKIIFGVGEDGFVYVRVNSGQWKLHYIYRDYQGSVTDTTDASSTVAHRMRYSPWEIKNVGSKSLNDWVPTSFAEADDYFGGNTTYEQYKTTTNYQQDVGVMASNRPNAYGRVLSKQFTGAPMPDPVSVLADPQQVLSIKKSGNLIHTNMPHSGGMGHVDNLRSIKYYHSGKIVTNFRIGSYRLSSVNGNWWFYTLNGLKQL